MSTESIIIGVRRQRNAAPVCRAVTGWCLPAVVLVLVSGGCRTPPLPDLRRQTASNAEARVNAPPATSRVRHEGELRTAPEVLPLVQGEMDEAAVSRVALINNPGLAAEYATLGVARSGLIRASRPSNPSVEAAARFGDEHNDAVDVKAVQDIVDLVLLPRQRAAAQRSFEAAKDRLTSRIMGVVREARSALVEYQASLALLERKQEVADCREAAMDVARRMFEAGNVTVLELPAFERRHHTAQLELAAARVDTRSGREAVNRAMGLHEDTEWKAKPAGDGVVERTNLPADSADRSALDASLELSAQRSEIEALARQRGIAKTKAYLPEVKVGVDSERDPDHEWAVGPALVLTVPLFDQGQAEIVAVDSQMEASWNRYAETAVAIASASRIAITRLDTLQMSLRRQREEVVPLCQKALQETLLQYNGMLVGVFDLLRAKEQEVGAHARLAELTREYRLAQIDLQHLLAGGEARATANASTGTPVQSDSGRDGH